MIKKIIVTIFFSGCVSCAPSILKTDNPNVPTLYRNGFKDYSIKPILCVDDNDSTYINELRFNAVKSAMYTEKLMYDRFGKWAEEIRQPNYKFPSLLWKNVKLFADDTTLYTVAANGTESYSEMFASVMVYDSNNNDCLQDKSATKSKMIQYFSDGIKKLSKKENFYHIFHEKFDREK